MSCPKVLLVNTNRAQPPVAPVGLDYLAAALEHKAIEPVLVDLAWENSTEQALKHAIEKHCPDLIGLSVRNIDDSSSSTREFFLDPVRDIVSFLKTNYAVPVVLGGCGFSIMPDRALRYCGGNFGIKGDGENALAELAMRLHKGQDYKDIAGLVFFEQGTAVANKTEYAHIEDMEFLSKRNFIDNRRYFEQGGQGNIETRRGCDQNCTYCADPIAKGRSMRFRRPEHVVEELSNLVEKGVDCFHFCDSEFNLPPNYAEKVCQATIKSGLNDVIKWYAYCGCAPFPSSLGRLMKKAGCLGINFGADSANPQMLSILGRGHNPDDVKKTARICRDNEIDVMFDLLIGAPYETRQSIHSSIDFFKAIDADAVGISVGIRLYEGTPLYEQLANDSARAVHIKDPLFPLYYVSENLGSDIEDYIRDLTADDERFLSFEAGDADRDYGYTDNQLLVNAIKKGYRGAYWHILKQVQQEKL